MTLVGTRWCEPTTTIEANSTHAPAPSNSRARHHNLGGWAASSCAGKPPVRGVGAAQAPAPTQATAPQRYTGHTLARARTVTPWRGRGRPSPGGPCEAAGRSRAPRRPRRNSARGARHGMAWHARVRRTHVHIYKRNVRRWQAKRQNTRGTRGTCMYQIVLHVLFQCRGLGA